MSDKLRRSEDISKLAEALAKAQGAFKVAEKNSTNPFLHNKYADLGSIILASREALSANGLSIVQTPTIDANIISVTTLLMHNSGEWIESDLSLPGSDSKGLSSAQSAGIVITYLRRYSYAPLLGIYAGEDEDGDEKPQPEKQKATPPPAPVRAETKPATAPAAPARPYAPEQVKAKIEAVVAKAGTPVKIPEKQYFTVVEAVENLFPQLDKAGKETARHAVMFYLVNTTSVKEMSLAQGHAVINWATTSGAVCGEALLEADAIMRKGMALLEEIAQKEKAA